MSKHSVIVAAAALVMGGCASNGVREVNMLPSRPVQVGTFDFDILQDVQGHGCETSILSISITPGYSAIGTPMADNMISLTGGNSSPLGLLGGIGMLFGSGDSGAGHAAAAYDAISKVKGADTVLVTRSMSSGIRIPLLYSNVCADVYGKAIRLKKGPTRK